MSFPQRLFIFCVGVGLGALLALYILKNRGLEEREKPPQTLAEAEVEAVPGILKAYQERGEPLQSPFIIGEFSEPGPQKGTYRRVFVLEGRQPGQLLRVEEIQSAKPDSTLIVESWRVMAADRVVIQLEADSNPSLLKEPLSQNGYRLLRKSDSPDSYVVDLNKHSPKAVDEAIEQIRVLGTPVLEVTPDYLDKPKSED